MQHYTHKHYKVNARSDRCEAATTAEILVFMTRLPFRAVLWKLAETDRDQFIKPNGDLNQSAMARVLKCRQSAISRALKNPRHQPSNDTVEAIREYFGVSAGFARGEESLLAPPEKRYSARTRAFADRFETLDNSQKKALEGLLNAFTDDASAPSRKRA